MAERMRGRLGLLTAATSVAVLVGTGAAHAQSTTAPPEAPPSAAQGDAQAPKFKSAVDLVSVTAVVRDRKGRFVSDLRRDDFIVVENGERRPIIGFNAQSDGPVRVAVLFDISGSMRVGTKAVDARQAARHIFSSLKTGDEAALFAFDTQLDRVTGFTKDFKGLEGKVDEVEQPFGQTSLYDAIAETAKAIVEETSGTGKLTQRAAIVVLTDGIDTKSRLTAPEVSAIASSIDVPVYVVAVMSAVDDPRNADYGTGSMSSGLVDLARWTGGDIFIAIAPAHASIAARQIVSEMRHQYMLAFEASARAGWRPLEVKAQKRDLVVRARSGYKAGGSLAPAETPQPNAARKPSGEREEIDREETEKSEKKEK